MAFQLTVAAEEDLIAIAAEGMRLFGETQAQKYHADLFSLFDLLAANPHMARERRDLSPPMRIQPFKAHLVVYTIMPNGGVLVVRVRHGRENWSDHVS